MRWLALVIAGPAIWATGFALVYALHGAGCNLGWQGVQVVGGLSLHHLALWAGWLVALAAALALLLAVRSTADDRLASWLPRAGAWIGVAATAISLLPVAVATSC